MGRVYIAWAISAAVLILVAAYIGRDAPGGGWLGVFIDSRGRYSLTKFQLTLWTILVVSLIAGLFFARWLDGATDALGFSIPDEVLIVMGISIGSAAASTTIKAGKDRHRPRAIAASNADDKPRFSQIFLLEEGDYADQVVDITKFQNFWFTLIAVGAYALLAIRAIENSGSVSEITLPGFTETLLTLLGVSHAGYLAGKLPNRPGSAPGLNLYKRRAAPEGTVPRPVGAAAGPPAKDITYVPRNPA